MNQGRRRIRRSTLNQQRIGPFAGLIRKPIRLLTIRRIRTRQYTPKTNGNTERFIQMLLREWANAIPFCSSETDAFDR